ncbi:hypothetical protein PVL29_007411 [Vitis rotundifolia]|uniref:Exocyst subunit Exo70 family protein n=1 Tax=Vitis rotundifolia TaxID=103349 RepID=A0AA39A0J6_VITRO|nr:hypothetical protein PVL29_007411 [Vitis rotundifolia]
MPRKGMRTIFFKASSPSSSHQSSPLRAPSSPLRESMMDENIDNAQSIISKWNSDESSFANFTSLFHSSHSESKQFLSAVADLQRAMHFFVNHDSTSEKLIRSQTLMQLAMKRLEKEFYQILSSSREYLDPDISDFEDDRTSEEEFGASSESVSGVERESELAMADLKAIADCMISSGYGKECVKIYKLVRKSIVDESLYHLGVERLSYSQIQKMDWEVIEKKIRHWLNAVKAAVKTLFYGERILCDHVFSASDSIRESCFSEITKEGALSLFGFPEHVARCKKTPEKMFRILDLYESISDLWPEIDSIFSFESTSAVLSQATSALIRLGEAVRTMLSDFEAAIQKDSSKTPIRGGGVHPLTRYVMNYISFLSDYSGVLSVIVAEWQPTVQSSMPESYFESPKSGDDPTPEISLRLAWLVLVLLCKLDGRAGLYKDVSLSYIFLANNLQYVTTKVRTSNLRYLLGDDWITKHEIKVKQYASNYERMGWSKVFSSLPENPSADISPEKAKEYFKKFNSAFEEVYRKQTSWVVPDNKLQEEIKLSIAKKLAPAYRAFYEKNRARLRREPGSESVVRFAPDDMGNYLSDLFYGTGVSGSTSSSSSPSSLSRG